MQPTRPTHRRRLRPIRLTDLPLELRRRAARYAKRRVDTPEEKLLIDIAANYPSNQIYWVIDDEEVLANSE